MLKRILFGGETSNSPLTNLGLTLLRVFAGFALMTHGYQKIQNPAGFIETVGKLGFPLPEAAGWAAMLAELLGGLFLLLGLLTRPAAFFVAFTMLMAVVNVHWNDPFAKKEMALLYLFIALAYMFMGANSWSIDGILRNRNR